MADHAAGSGGEKEKVKRTSSSRKPRSANRQSVNTDDKTDKIDKDSYSELPVSGSPASSRKSNGSISRAAANSITDIHAASENDAPPLATMIATESPSQPPVSASVKRASSLSLRSAFSRVAMIGKRKSVELTLSEMPAIGNEESNSSSNSEQTSSEKKKTFIQRATSLRMSPLRRNAEPHEGAAPSPQRQHSPIFPDEKNRALKGSLSTEDTRAAERTTPVTRFSRSHEDITENPPPLSPIPPAMVQRSPSSTRSKRKSNGHSAPKDPPQLTVLSENHENKNDAVSNSAQSATQSSTTQSSALLSVNTSPKLTRKKSNRSHPKEESDDDIIGPPLSPVTTTRKLSVSSDSSKHSRRSFSSISRHASRRKGVDAPIFKIVFVGEPNSGKTSFINSYVDASFQKEYHPTRGIMVQSRRISDPDEDEGDFILEIWEATGTLQEPSVPHLRNSLFSKVLCVVIAFDLQQGVQSLNSLAVWHKYIRGFNESARIFLLGTKHDLFTSLPFDVKVSLTVAARKLAASLQTPLIFSAASNIPNVAEVFQDILLASTNSL